MVDLQNEHLENEYAAYDRDDQDEALNGDYDQENQTEAMQKIERDVEEKRIYTGSLARVVADTLAMARRKDCEESVQLALDMFLDSLEAKGFVEREAVLTSANFILSLD